MVKVESFKARGCEVSINFAKKSKENIKEYYHWKKMNDIEN